MDGYLKIKTKLDNSGIDKDITALENKIKKIQTNNADMSQEEDSLQQEINNYQKLQQQADSYRETIKRLNEERRSLISGGLRSSDVPMYNSIITELDQVKQKYEQATTEIDKQAPKIEKIYSKLDKVKAKQLENNEKITEFKNKIESIKVDKVENQIGNIGKSIQNQIGKIGKMAIAVIGIRTAWGAVRSAISMVSQYNSQISTDLEYMRYCIANAIAPVVQRLISLLYTLLSYVNTIATAWFGINLFANSSASAFQKMQNSASSTAKSAKEIQKSLQGFDEMNILQDDGSTSGNAGTGISVPSMDLSNMQAEVPEWIKWIVDNKDLILSVMAGVTAGLLAWKIGLGGLKSLGIGVLIAGIVYAVQSLLEYLKDPTFTNLGSFIQGIGVALLGLAIIIGNLPLAVVAAVVLIWGIIVKYWDQIKAFFQGGIDWLKGKSDWIREMFGDTVGDIYDTFVEGLQEILNWFDFIFKGIKDNFNEIISFVKNVFSGNWEAAWENIKNIFGNIWDSIVNTIKTLASIISKIAINIGRTVGSTIAGAFKAIVNGVLWAIENTLNTPIKAVNALIGVINKVPGINLGYLNTFNLPRLAKGGVIAQPTTAIIGEAGKEAVLPLENNLEYLDILADRIASKISNNGGYYMINMNGRVIQRGIAKRQQELAFAKNGR